MGIQHVRGGGLMSIRAIMAALTAAGGPPVVDSPHWNPADKSPSAFVSSDGKTAYRPGTSNGHALVRGVQSRASGKWYVEFFTPVERSNVPGGGITVGVVRGDNPLGSAPGETANGYGVQARRYLGDFDSIWTYNNGVTVGDSFVVAAPGSGWVGMALDLDAQKVWWVADGVWAGDKSPKASAGANFANLASSGPYFPAVSCYYGHDSYPTLECVLRVNPGEMAMDLRAFQPGGELEGFAPWDGSAIPSPEVARDPLWANVQSLLHFDGVNNSTDFHDEIEGNTWTVGGGAKISTAQSVFGGASGDFTGNDGSKYIELPDRASLRPGTGPYAIEYTWLYQASGGQWATVFQKGVWNSAGGLTVIANGSNVKVCANGADSGDISHAMRFGQQYRFSIERDESNICRLFINGVLRGSWSQPQNINGTDPIQLMKGGGIVDPARGYLEEFRYTVGAKRHTTNHTPETAAFSNTGPA